jgi:hypothetical protein
VHRGASIILRRGETEMAYSEVNRGALFRNEDKTEGDDRERDYSGSLDVEGVAYWVSGWVRTSKAGKKYLSISIKPKVEKPAESEGEKPATGVDGSGKAVGFDDPNSIPF